MNNHMRSKLAYVKGLGSAKSGVTHWLHQRLTAVFMIPLFIWFIISIICMITKSSPNFNILQLLDHPMQVILITLLINLILYHGILGIKIIIEDYVHCETLKNTGLIILYAINILTMVSVTIAIVGYHFHNLIIR